MDENDPIAKARAIAARLANIQSSEPSGFLLII